MKALGKTYALLATAALAASLVGAAACAVGAQGDDNVDAAAPVDDDPVGSAPTKDSGHTPFSDDSGPPAMPPMMGPSTDAGSHDGSSDAQANGDGGDGGGAPVVCASPTDCSGAIAIGNGNAVSGDTGSDMQTGDGNTSKWFTVRVGENNSSLFSGQDLKLKADLVSPPGVNYDLFLYVNPANDVRECSTPTGSSTSTSANDSATLEWGEGSFPNGSDDGRTVSIEVRYVSGTCAPANTWTLTVQGNAP